MSRVSLLMLIALAGCNTGKNDNSKVDTGTIGDGVVDDDNDGYTVDEDCNDNDQTVHPGATEVCDGVDNNCDDTVDEDVTTTYYRDADGDGFGDADTTDDACEKPTGYVPNGNDCDDTAGNAYPGNTETCDGIDNDCDGETDEGVSTTYYADSDVDGFGDPSNSRDSCSQPSGYVTDDTDCDDTTSSAFPGNLEVCDELDNDCDGTVDEDVTTTYYADVDADDWGDPSTTQEACSEPTGYTTTSGDCDDGESTTNPDATEYCDEVDNDCDGSVDEDDAADAADWYADGDADAYGDPDTTVHQCYSPSGYVSDNTDCDDTDGDNHPGADEYCDEEDNDCDGKVDEDDALDASTWYADDDRDGYGDPSDSDVACDAPTGHVSDNTDCDDTDEDNYPGADEYCDEEDNDCDGDIDEDGEVVDGDTFYADADSDDLGDPDDTIIACDAPSGYTDNTYDCNDSDSTEPVVVDSSGGSASGSGTLSSPLDAIQDGVDRANECVIVFAGTYRENIDLSSTDIDVWGVEGADFTYINGGADTCDSGSPTGCAPTVTFAGGTSSTATLRDFTITGGSGFTSSSSSTTDCADSSTAHSGKSECTVTIYEYFGGGIYIDGDDPNLEDLVIIDNVLPQFEQTAMGSFIQYWLYSYGGGIAVIDGAPELTGVNIYENFADEGGGVYVGTGAVVTHKQSLLAENTATDGAAYNIDDGELSATNIIAAFNDADTDAGGVFVQNTGSAEIINTILAYNDSSSGSTRGDSLYVSSGTSVTWMNSIVFGKSSNPLVYSAGTFSSSYSDRYNSSSGGTYGGSATAGTGDLAVNPYFTSVTDDGNYKNDKWSLSSSSTCIDAGNPSSSYYDADGSRNDMGAEGGPEGDWR